MNQIESRAQNFFEVGKLYCDRGDFKLAVQKLEQAAEIFLNDRQFDQYVQCVTLMLRLFAETEQRAKIASIKERLQDLIVRYNVQVTSRTYYTLALCAAYRDHNDEALEYLYKALSIALSQHDKTDLCYVISGFAITYRRLGRLEEALREIEKLYVFFEVLDVPDLKISTYLTHGHILAMQKKFDAALENLWRAYDLVRQHKTMQMHIYTLYAIGWVYLKAGDRDLARIYLNLAAKAVDPENLVRLAKQIENDLGELGLVDKRKFDLVFDLENHAVVERRLGRVDFKNQYVLLDLLRLFVQSQGQVFSKEYLVEHVWKQTYDPAVHDNKVYVTIKRLRKLIEPDFDRPKYIFRAKNGYYMSKTAKILVETSLGGLS